ncbi:unnamed protein product [Closterium sp. Naga37s-1]|nr:unnamed protein product [Closterium sp. Naga37s-1]
MAGRPLAAVEAEGWSDARSGGMPAAPHRCSTRRALHALCTRLCATHRLTRALLDRCDKRRDTDRRVSRVNCSTPCSTHLVVKPVALPPSPVTPPSLLRPAGHCAAFAHPCHDVIAAWRHTYTRRFHWGCPATAASSAATAGGATSVGATSVGTTSAGATSAGATSAGATSAGATSVGATSAGATSAGAMPLGASDASSAVHTFTHVLHAFTVMPDFQSYNPQRPKRNPIFPLVFVPSFPHPSLPPILWALLTLSRNGPCSLTHLLTLSHPSPHSLSPAPSLSLTHLLTLSPTSSLSLTHLLTLSHPPPHSLSLTSSLVTADLFLTDPPLPPTHILPRRNPSPFLLPFYSLTIFPCSPISSLSPAPFLLPTCRRCPDPTARFRWCSRARQKPTPIPGKVQQRDGGWCVGMVGGAWEWWVVRGDGGWCVGMEGGAWGWWVVRGDGGWCVGMVGGAWERQQPLLFTFLPPLCFAPIGAHQTEWHLPFAAVQ